MTTMTRWRWRQWRTGLDIGVWRFGWLWGVILATALAVLVFQWVVVPQQHRANDLTRQALQTVETVRAQQRQRQASVVPMDQDAQPLADLRRISVAESDVGEVLRRISQMANAQGLSLAQSDVQTSSEGHGGLRQVQVTLPLRASYPQLRQWVEAVLRQLPGVSVDQIALRRETAAQGQAEVRVKLSIWVDLDKEPSGRSLLPAATTPTKPGGRP